MPGDVIQLEVYAKYADPVTSNWTGALTTLMSQIAAGQAGVSPLVWICPEVLVGICDPRPVIGWLRDESGFVIHHINLSLD